MIDKIIMYFTEYPFVRYALIVGILVALCSSLVGVTLVLKRFSFIGDGLSHVAFGAIAVSSVVGLGDNMFIVLPVTILCAVMLLKTGNDTSTHGDSAIAMLSVAALGIGYLLMNVFSVSTNIAGDVCSTLFGSSAILTLSLSEVWLCIFLSLVVIVLFVLFYNKLFAITFDQSFAKAVGINTEAYNLFLAIVIAVIIVLAMNLVGSLLVSALIVFPALSSMSIFNSFKSVTVFSAVLSVFCATVGIIFSILAATPVGPTIVVANIIVHIVCRLISGMIRRA